MDDGRRRMTGLGVYRGCADGAGLFVASGHFRDGVELAPITAQLLADLICDARLDPLLAPFTPDRFAHVEVTR